MIKKRVLLGMSGGVDSSVAAVLLRNAGYDVTGVTLSLRPVGEDGEDSQKDDINDAKKVCDVLGIEHMVFDFKDIFKKNVIDYFINEYVSGRTPNPCIACNNNIKFGAMFNKADDMGFDYIATGHYASVQYDEHIGRYLLKRANSEKDQSYVLYGLNQDKLSRILFPLFNMEKSEIRKIAVDYKLPVAYKGDSQEICFIKDNNYHRFIESCVSGSFSPGNFIDKENNILGIHRGIENYTIGQRKGLNISFGKPMYVIKIDSTSNTVMLGENSDLYTNTLEVFGVNFIHFSELSGEMKVTAKVRYNSKDSDATIIPLCKGRVKVLFKEPQRAVTPGQAVVFYDGDLVVGGGTIL